MNKIEAFNWWLTCIPDRINELREKAEKEIGGPLDGSLSSLDALEAYLINKFTYDEMIAPENRVFLDQLASYVGDVAEKHLENAEWTINLSDENDVNFNFPVLKFGGNFFNPFTVITTSLDRKKGDFIRKRIAAINS